MRIGCGELYLHDGPRILDSGCASGTLGGKYNGFRKELILAMKVGIVESGRASGTYEEMEGLW